MIKGGIVRALLTAGAAVSLAVCLAACGTASPTTLSSAAPSATPTLPPQRVKVGAMITLTGADDSGEADKLKVGVEVKKVVLGAAWKGAFAKPGKGQRLVAVRFMFKNTGEALYDDSPAYGAKLVDSDGHTYDPLEAAVTNGPGFGNDVKLKHGQSKTGYIVFMVPKAAKIVNVEYALNAGYAADSALWQLA
jgi:Domain of unknown function (DUF4352)